jgi:hypothetical protein
MFAFQCLLIGLAIMVEDTSEPLFWGILAIAALTGLLS